MARVRRLVGELLKDAPNRPGAEAFIVYVQSDQGRAVLTAAGFQ